jgi:hypothetical protein
MVIQIWLFSILYFSLAKNRRREWFFRVYTRYRKIIGEWKDIESEFYANDSPNDDLTNEI